MKTTRFVIWAAVAGLLVSIGGQAVAIFICRLVCDHPDWIVGLLLTGWVLVSLSICFFGFFAHDVFLCAGELQLRWNSCGSWVIGVGAFIGCMTILTSGLYFLLWFVPGFLLWLLPGWVPPGATVSGLSLVRLPIATVVAFYATIILATSIERDQKLRREVRIDRDVSNTKHRLMEGSADLMKLRQDMETLEKSQEQGKLGARGQERLMVLQQVLAWAESVCFANERKALKHIQQEIEVLARTLASRQSGQPERVRAIPQTLLQELARELETRGDGWLTAPPPRGSFMRDYYDDVEEMLEETLGSDEDYDDEEDEDWDEEDLEEREETAH